MCAASQTDLLERVGRKSNMICGVHGCPGCSVTPPIASNTEPAGDAFAVAIRLSGCAQLAAATEIAAMANEQRTGLIIF